MHWWLHFLEADLALQNDNEKTFVNDHVSPRVFSAYLFKKKSTLYRLPVETAVEEFQFHWS